MRSFNCHCRASCVDSMMCTKSAEGGSDSLPKHKESLQRKLYQSFWLLKINILTQNIVLKQLVLKTYIRFQLRVSEIRNSVSALVSWMRCDRIRTDQKGEFYAKGNPFVIVKQVDNNNRTNRTNNSSIEQHLELLLVRYILLGGKIPTTSSWTLGQQ